MTASARLRSSGRGAALLLYAVAATAAPLALAQPPSAAESVPLRVGAAESATHGADERFEYEIELPAGTPHLLVVDQLGLDLIVSVHSPDGATQSFNTPSFRDGREVAVVDPASGAYRIGVRSEEHTGARGGHSIVLVPLSTDPREAEAWRAMSAAAAENFEGGENGWQRAAEDYARAGELWRELGRTREQADASFARANLLYWQLYDWDGAVELAARAAELYRALDEAALAANAEHLQAAALTEKALEAAQSASESGISAESEQLFTDALTLYERARATHERLGRIYDLAAVLNNFGYTYYGKGDFTRARAYYAQAAALQQSVAEWSAEIKSLANIAVLDAETGELLSAHATFDRTLELLPETRTLERAYFLDNRSAVERMLGDLEQALTTATEALELHRQIDNELGVGIALRRIGETYSLLGQLEVAPPYLRQALEIAERTGDGRGQEAAHRILGNVAYLERDYTAALDHHRRALEVAASTSDRAHLELLVAKDLLALGRAADAKVQAQRAHDAAEAAGTAPLLAGALNALGRAQVLTGETAEAVANLERAAAAFDELALRSEHADALHGLALAARAAGDLDAAAAHGERALQELEALRSGIASPELRAFFAAVRSDYYEAQVDALMARAAERSAASDVRAALAVTERGRARMIAELFGEAAVDLRAELDPDLRARQRALSEQLAESNAQRDALLARGADGAELDSVLAELAALESARDLIEIELRRGNPKYAEVAAPQPLTPDGMQARLDDDTVLLQYMLGAERSYVFAVTREAVHAVPLANRATIDDAVRRALAVLQDRSTPPPRGAEGGPVRALADLVLAPAAAHLGRQRVVLALDGALQYVPFAALPLEASDGAFAPLLATHEIVEVPSLSALAAAPPRRNAAPAHTLAVLADPVLQRTDPRLTRTPPPAQTAVAAVMPARAAAGAPLERLLATGYEAETIAALVPTDSRFVARGFEASREIVLDGALGDFRYVHFATHGVVDSRYPALSALVLSQYDGDGNPQDGYLRLDDIYNLKLDADLVVLSACETALGREVRGEGLVGLTQAFMFAGARSLIASLWQVPDRATAELMAEFYGYLLRDGLRPAEALRKAQLWSASQRRYQHPYYWAGFVLVGDWQ